MTKRCSACGEDKRVSQDLETSEFWAKTRNEDGSARTWQSRCKRCHRAAGRAREERIAAGRPKRIKKGPWRRSPAQAEEQRRYAAAKRRVERELRERKVDRLVELLRTQGTPVIERRRTKWGATTRLIIRKPDGSTGKVAVLYRNVYRRRDDRQQRAA